MFRKVNERIAELAALWDTYGDLHVICECKQVGCGELLAVPIEQYERSRTNNWLIVKQGHAVVQVEHILEQHGAYDMIEADGTAG